MYNNSRMVGRYYEQFPIDTNKGLSNYSLTLLGSRADQSNTDTPHSSLTLRAGAGVHQPT